MTDLRMMATEFAKEMIEHNLKNGVQVLDKEYIAKDACELAYLIDKNVVGYEGLTRTKHGNQPDGTYIDSRGGVWDGEVSASGVGAAQGSQA